MFASSSSIRLVPLDFISQPFLKVQDYSKWNNARIEFSTNFVPSFDPLEWCLKNGRHSGGRGVRTHIFLVMSLLPYSLDHSYSTELIFVIFDPASFYLLTKSFLIFFKVDRRQYCVDGRTHKIFGVKPV